MERAFRRELDALGELLGFVDEFARAERLSEKIAFASRLVVEELFANFVRHNVGGRDQIEVSLAREADRLVLKLRDFDVEPFDGSRHPPVDIHRPLGERTAGGLGIHFVRSFFDDLTYDYSDGTMCVTAAKNLGRTDVRHQAQ